MSCQKRKRDRARLRDTKETDIALVKAFVGATVLVPRKELKLVFLRVEAAATEAGNIDICTNFVVT